MPRRARAAPARSWWTVGPRSPAPRTPRGVQGRAVVTLEGLPEATRDLFAGAFVAAGAAQCGYCTPGIVMKAEATLNREPDATREVLARSLTGQPLSLHRLREGARRDRDGGGRPTRRNAGSGGCRRDRGRRSRRPLRRAGSRPGRVRVRPRHDGRRHAPRRGHAVGPPARGREADRHVTCRAGSGRDPGRHLARRPGPAEPGPHLPGLAGPRRRGRDDPLRRRRARGRCRRDAPCGPRGRRAGRGGVRGADARS